MPSRTVQSAQPQNKKPFRRMARRKFRPDLLRLHQNIRLGITAHRRILVHLLIMVLRVNPSGTGVNQGAHPTPARPLSNRAISIHIRPRIVAARGAYHVHHIIRGRRKPLVPVRFSNIPHRRFHAARPPKSRLLFCAHQSRHLPAFSQSEPSQGRTKVSESKDDKTRMLRHYGIRSSNQLLAKESI